ncbi:uncharacterized protein BDV14DRAFT_198357 [Aspergillus stella-maris]|uniref:uncharacterized protein n=1 Tax=Aspergillus stella-maris TaxID=1810926 RepID=UPI003CCDC677
MSTPIAVIGTAFRFPGDVNSPAYLWELLSNPRDIRSHLNLNRLDIIGDTVNIPSKSYLLNETHTRHFDAAFFNISAAEAEAMDPQQRILLETAYEALEGAGYSLVNIRGSSTAVFIGAMTSDYRQIQTRDLDTLSRWHATGTSSSILASRLSYFFDLHGPSMTIDTACSSSLVALHQAVVSLQTGECTTAIVGGVNLILDAETYISHSKLHMLSPTSKCRMWDRDADGYARGEGCAILVIKTLDKALQDGDDIECVIRGTGVNSDGRSMGLTMPTAHAQTALIRQTYERAGLDPVRDRCQYFECHGTGTQAGDPVEAKAIRDTFFPDNTVWDPEEKLYVGSIKTVIGHLEGCAGLAGVMKVLMCVKQRTMTPNLHFDALNPAIAPYYSQLNVVTKSLQWPLAGNGAPMRASVNSFGFGGTNAHVIIESYESRRLPNRISHTPILQPGPSTQVAPFLLSAASEKSLVASIDRTAQHVKDNQSINLNDLAWTLSRRSVFSHRFSAVAESRAGLAAALEEAANSCRDRPDGEASGISHGPLNKSLMIMGVFTGQGAQWEGMGKDLLRESPVFRDSIDVCERALRELPDGPSWSIRQTILGQVNAGSATIRSPEVSQPLTTAIQIALCDLLRASDVTLEAVVGHSSGELAAAYSTGILSAEDCMKIAYYRGFHCRETTTEGAMMAVGLSLQDAKDLCSESSLRGRIVVGASNAPASTTLSGDRNAILEVKELLDKRRVLAQLLHVDVAYHSHHMLLCAVSFLESLNTCNIQVRAPATGCTWISSVTGHDMLQCTDINSLAGQYWVDHLVNAVRFGEAIDKSLSQTPKPLGACIEIGPHPTLRGPAMEVLRSHSIESVPYLSLLRRGRNDLMVASSAISSLWQRMPDRVDVSKWIQACGNTHFRLIKDLPSYSWDYGGRYWKESRLARRRRLEGAQCHPLLGRQHINDECDEVCWRNTFDFNRSPWPRGLRRENKEVLTGSVYISCLLEAAKSIVSIERLDLLELQDFNVVQPLALDECSGEIEYITELRIDTRTKENPAIHNLHVDASIIAYLAESTMPSRLCTAHLVLHMTSSRCLDNCLIPPRTTPAHASHPKPVDVADLFNMFEHAGASYSGPYKRITSITQSFNRGTASVFLEEQDIGFSQCLHPALPEAMTQLLLSTYTSPPRRRLSTSWEASKAQRILLNPALSGRNSQHEIDAQITGVSNKRATGDVSLYSAEGIPMVRIEGLLMQPVSDLCSARNYNPYPELLLTNYPIWRSSHPTQPGSLPDIGIRATDTIDVVDPPISPSSLRGRKAILSPVSYLPRSSPDSRVLSYIVDYTSPVDSAPPRYSQCPASQVTRTSTGEQLPHKCEKPQTLLERLCRKLESLLRLPARTLNVSTPLLDLGCDSLVAVDIHSWLVSEVEMDITPMDILHATVVSLCEKAEFLVEDPYQGVTSEDNSKSSENTTPAITTDHSLRELHPCVVSSQSSLGSPVSDPALGQGKESPVARFSRVEKMSQQQKQIWFADHWMDIPGQYNVVLSYRVERNLLLPKFKAALENAVARHESLRTAFFVDSNTGELLQGILRDSLPFFSHVSSNGDDTAVSREFDRLRSYPWDLEGGEVFGVTVVSASNDDHTVVFAFHHIIMDGASMSAFLRDVERFYEGTPTDIVAQYADYSVKQDRGVQIVAHAKELEYWKTQLSPLPGIMPVLPCARENTRPSSPSDNFQIHTSVRRVNTGLSQRIKEQSRSLRGTPFHFYLTALQVFLVEKLNIKDLCIGVADANRRDEQFSGTVGYFLNMLPLQLRCKGTENFSGMYRNTTSSVLSALSNSSIPSNLILDALNVPREANVTPLFQVAINYRVGEITRMSVSDFDLVYERSVMGTAPYDISLHITQCADGSSLAEVNCRDYIYSSEATHAIADDYMRILETMSTDCSPDVPAITLSLRSPVNLKIEKGLSVSRGQRIAHGWPDTLIDRFQEVATQYGDRVAIVDEMGSFTYDELSKKMLCMEELLLQATVKPGDKVAVLCRPSVNVVVSMLAILRVGAVYVPLDLSLPSARHKNMVLASTCTAMIYMPGTADRARELGVRCMVNASDIRRAHALSTPSTPSTKKEPRESNQKIGNILTALLYTSGSTGQPKGVCLPQRGFVNYLAAKRRELNLDASAVILQQSSLGFDMGIAQTLNAFMNGARLVIVPQEMRGDSADIARMMVNHGVTFTLGTPSEYLSLVQHGADVLTGYTGWRHACLGGEPFTDQLKREFARLGDKGPQVMQDSYGVTEISACTTFETMSVLQLEASRSVGKAIPNTSLYIVDSDCKLVPTGEPGEICVGGVGVALGYLDEQQTKKKFINDPFALPEDIEQGWTQLYRTGDRGKLLEDGSLVLLGRMDGDTEIKLRGLRIDLEDVASTMVNTYPDLLLSAVVCVKGEGISQYLVAFVSLVAGRTAQVDELQKLASNLPLPQYMHPARVICLDEIPRTSNGKIDRKEIEAMPCCVSVDRTTERKPKRFTLGEGELKLLWERILPDRYIEPESDFFLLGGNSALLVNLQGTIRTCIGVALTLRELYSNSTLANMALQVSARKAEVPSSSINWAVETAMPPGLLAHVDPAPITTTTTSNHAIRNVRGGGRHILLTGVTTFLGRSLVQALLSLPEVQRVHCIAVNKDESHDLPSNDKLVVYPGTLLDPTLGLSAQDWDRLRGCINVIIHAGSTGHCLNTYHSLKKPNVSSTHRLAEFALQTNPHAPIYYISSPRTILFSGRNTYPPTSLAKHLPLDKDGTSDGLTATKWASEVFLERFAQVTGTKVVIHRPCTAIGDDAPPQDALNSLLRYSRDLGATPRLAKMDGFLDFEDVNAIADEIANAVISPFRDGDHLRAAGPPLFSSASKLQDQNSPTVDRSTSTLTSSQYYTVSFIHHSSNVKVPVNSFKQYMEKVHGQPFKELPLEEWSSLALERGIEPLIPSFLQAIDEGDEVYLHPSPIKIKAFRRKRQLLPIYPLQGMNVFNSFATGALALAALVAAAPQPDPFGVTVYSETNFAGQFLQIRRDGRCQSPYLGVSNHGS